MPGEDGRYSIRTTSTGLKVLRKFYPCTARGRANYFNEKQVLQHLGILNVRHVARLYNCDDQLYMIETHLIEGVELHMLPVARTGRLTMRLALARRILRAVLRLHAQGVAHLDLKPENILVTDSSEVHLIDFDLSHLGYDTSKRYRGTLNYMSPEVVTLRSVEKRQMSPEVVTRYDAYAADRWSVACVLYELFHHGRVAFDHFEDDLVIEDVTSCNIRVWSCEPEVRDILKPMFMLEPSARPRLEDVHEQLVQLAHRLVR